MKGLQAILHQVEAKYSKAKRVDFKPGDSVKVSLKVKEGEKERVQAYEGVVISRGKEGSRETFRVRRISYGVGVERVFPFHSPTIVKIEVTKRGVAFKARLFHLRGKSAKDSRIAEMRATDKGGALIQAEDVVLETAEQSAERIKLEGEKAVRMAEKSKAKKERQAETKTAAAKKAAGKS